MNTLYLARATAIGGRGGAVASSDGNFRTRLAVPTALGGEGAAAPNPEQLFAAAYAACFLDAIKRVAGDAHTSIAGDSNVTATVGIGRRGEGEALALSIGLSIDLPGLDRETSERLVSKADMVCPYSALVRGNAEVRVSIA